MSKENHNNEIIIENYKEMFTLVTSLKACANEKDLYKGTILHADILYRGLLQRSPYLAATLITMYCKCGMLMKAHRVLKELPVQNIVSWNALISGYVQDGQSDNAMSCFEQMVNEGLSPDPVTFICILKACGRMRAIDKGKQIHNEIIKRGLLETNLMLGNGLVDMYVKCGMLVKAQEALEDLPTRDVVSWNSLIAGFAQHGHSHEALNCFEWMQCEGVCPDEVTCLCILTACSHSGHVDEGEAIFANMTKKYGIIPNLEHHTCMMVSYGCAGQLKRAMASFNMMSSFDFSTLHLLLGVCRKWGNVELGTLAFNEAIHLDNSCAGG